MAVKIRKISLIVLTLFVSLSALRALELRSIQSDYHNYEETSNLLKKLSGKHSEKIKLLSIGKSASGKEIWLLRLAEGDEASIIKRPGIFVGANISGCHNIGTEAALHLAQTLAKDNKVLKNRAFYIVPIMNPDAHSQYFSEIRFLNRGNGFKYDRDKDGFIDEDDVNDLNKDGMITQMRFKDPLGEWVIDQKNPQLMVKAKDSDGPETRYQLLTEGYDDDGDGQQDEDGRQGYHPNKNFPHHFHTGHADAGPWASYTPESQALMDFMFEHRHIAATIIFDETNSLLKIPGKFPGAEAPANEVKADDVKTFKSLAKKYKKHFKKNKINFGKNDKVAGRGAMFPWMYYQYGSLAMELDVWSIAEEESQSKEKKKNTETSSDSEIKFSYVEKSLPDARVDWVEVTLLNGKKVEVGGYDPFVDHHPHLSLSQNHFKAHTDFVIEVASQLAEIKIVKAEAKKLADNTYQIIAAVKNTGGLPSHSKMCQIAKSQLPIRLGLEHHDNITVLHGPKWASTENLNPGSGVLKGSWLIKVNDLSEVKLLALSRQAGQDSKVLELPQ